MTEYKDRLYNFKIVNDNGSRKVYMMVLEPMRQRNNNRYLWKWYEIARFNHRF